MPVILDRLAAEHWLDPSFGTHQMALAAVLRSIPSERIEMHDVSPLVNSPENDTAACIEAISERKASGMPRGRKPGLFDEIHGEGAFTRLRSFFDDPTLNYDRIARHFRISRQRVAQIAEQLHIDGKRRRIVCL